MTKRGRSPLFIGMLLAALATVTATIVVMAQRSQSRGEAAAARLPENEMGWNTTHSGREGARPRPMFPGEQPIALNGLQVRNPDAIGVFAVGDAASSIHDGTPISREKVMGLLGNWESEMDAVVQPTEEVVQPLIVRSNQVRQSVINAWNRDGSIRFEELQAAEARIEEAFKRLGEKVQRDTKIHGGAFWPDYGGKYRQASGLTR